MMKVCVWTVCLFTALTVGVKSLRQTGYVGQNVTFQCSDWEGYTWSDVTSYVKYISTENKHEIMRVKPGDINQKDRISLYNNGGTLSVTFTDVQKSDSGTYYCGLDRWGHDIYIQVILHVIDVTPGPQTTVRTVSVWSSSTVFSNSKNITSDISPLFTTRQSTAAAASEAHGDEGNGTGSVLYLIIGFTVVITTLVLLLCLMMKIKKERKKKVSKSGSPEAVVQQDADYAEIRHEDHTERVSAADVHPETLYANYSSQQDTAQQGRASHDASASSSHVRHTDSQFECLYTVAQLPEERPECESATND
ncbi:CMRF35-like molecule 1 isoform X2 [Betta splendens]|uniref:CMRF35-like molecule 1 isoform X2 n=1 Tax=Betta splendens TaxID=158456 RepID=A0A9W2XT61_BETSP|nr:CMRF35-like molecule 1 isoform X2 [Betta splendens]